MCASFLCTFASDIYNHKESSVFYSERMILKIITLEHSINLYLFKFKT